MHTRIIRYSGSRTHEARVREHGAVTWSPDDLLTRSTFRELLELLSSREAQLRYETDVPIANVPAELLDMWFDDRYHPETPWFSQAFTDHERQVLADFNAFFSGVAERLPTDRGVAALHAEPVWDDVCAKASEVLAELD